MTAIATAVVAAVVAPAASAGPGDIAKDLKDGRLDGSYTRQELSEYVTSSMAQGYGNPVTAPPVGSGGVAGVSTKQTSPPTTPAGAGKRQASPLGDARVVGSLPFTGVDLAFIAIGGALLLALGAAARRLATTRG